MAVTIQAPKGTEDVLGSESYKWQFIENLAKQTAALYGFSEQRTPTFESMALFRRSVGDTTDVVQKEMYQVRAETESSKKEPPPSGSSPSFFYASCWPPMVFTSTAFWA